MAATMLTGKNRTELGNYNFQRWEKISSTNRLSNNNEPVKLKSIDRVKQIPVVKRGYNYAEDFYQQAKSSNKLISWTFGTVESSLKLASFATQPVTYLLETPILALDNQICQSLDVVEKKFQVAMSDPQESKYSQLTKDTQKYVEDILTQMETYADKRLPQDFNEHILQNKYKNIEELFKTAYRAYIVLQKFQIGLLYCGLTEIRDLTSEIIESVYAVIYILALIPIDPSYAVKKYQELMYIHHNLSVSKATNLRELLELTVQDITQNSKYLLRVLGNNMRKRVTMGLRDVLIDVIKIVESFDIIVVKLLFS